MSKQVLTEEERKLIRSDIYKVKDNEPTDFGDKKIQFFLRYCKGGKILDIGCLDHDADNSKSRYWLHKAIRSVAKSVVGLDYYAPGVEKLRKIGFDVVEGDAQSFKFEEKFDVIAAGDLVEHLPDLNGFFNSVTNALEVNGVLVMSTPNPWCWKYILYHTIFFKLVGINREHIAWFCLQTIENMGKRYGFEVVEHEYSSRRLYERLVPLPAHIKHPTLSVAMKKVSISSML